MHVGDCVQKTIDLFTVTGMAVLIHSDPEVLAADVALIRKMEVEGDLFLLGSRDSEQDSPRRALSAALRFLPPCFEFLFTKTWAWGLLPQTKQ